MQLGFFVRSGGQSFYAEVVSWALVTPGGYVAQPATTATKYRGAALGWVTPEDYVDPKGMKLHVRQTGWRTARCIPLCQYRAEVSKARILKIEELKKQAQREKMVELLKALTFAATVICPMLRVGTTIWSLVETLELTETLETVTKVAESVLVNHRTSVFDVLYDVLLDRSVSKAGKTFFLGALDCVYPCLSKRMAKVAGTGFDIWDAYPGENESAAGDLVSPMPEDQILDDIYRFRMGTDEAYRNAILRGFSERQEAWTDYFNRVADTYQKGRNEVLRPPTSFMFQPDCNCSFCKPLVPVDGLPRVTASPGTRGY